MCAGINVEICLRQTPGNHDFHLWSSIVFVSIVFFYAHVLFMMTPHTKRAGLNRKTTFISQQRTVLRLVFPFFLWETEKHKKSSDVLKIWTPSWMHNINRTSECLGVLGSYYITPIMILWGPEAPLWYLYYYSASIEIDYRISVLWPLSRLTAGLLKGDGDLQTSPMLAHTRISIHM